MATKSENTNPTMLTQEQLAARLVVEENTLEDWRMKGVGPTFIKLGFAKNSPIRYRFEDVEAWEASLPRITPIAQSVDAAYERFMARPAVNHSSPRPRNGR